MEEEKRESERERECQEVPQVSNLINKEQQEEIKGIKKGVFDNSTTSFK